MSDFLIRWCNFDRQVEVQHIDFRISTVSASFIKREDKSGLLERARRRSCRVDVTTPNLFFDNTD